MTDFFLQTSKEGQGLREAPLVTNNLVFLMIWFYNNMTKRELMLTLKSHLPGWKSHGIIFSFCSPEGLK